MSGHVVQTTTGVLHTRNEKSPLTFDQAEHRAKIANEAAEKMGLKTRYVVAAEEEA